VSNFLDTRFRARALDAAELLGMGSRSRDDGFYRAFRALDGLKRVPAHDRATGSHAGAMKITV